MASRKRNNKTHPKADGNDPDTYVAPDRPEVLSTRSDESAEQVDLNSGATTEVDVKDGEGRTVEREAGDGASDGEGRSAAGADSHGTAVARGSRRGADGAGPRGDDEDEEGEGAGYSRRVRGRIRRERANLNRERQLRQQAEARVTEERTARQALADRLEKVERQQNTVATNADVKALEAQIQALVPQITAATEAGETAKALDLQIKLGELQGDLKVLKYDLGKRQEQAERDSAEAKRRETAQRTAATDGPDPIAKETSNRFIRMNRHWWNRSKNQEAREDAVAIDKEVLQDLADGELEFEAYSDEHFEEIARRLHKTYPDLELADLDGQPYEFDNDEDDQDMNDRDERGRDRDRRDARRDDRRDTRAPVGRGPGGAGRSGRRQVTDVELARQGKVTLTQEDKNTMRTFGMNPDNPEDKKYFAKERQRSILTDDRRQQNNTGARR